MGALVVLAFILPGLAVGLALRLRGWTLAAAAPVLTFGTVALGTLVIGNLGIAWNLLSLALWTVVLTAVVGAVTWLVARRTGSEPLIEEPRRSLGENLVVLGGVVLGMAVGAATFLRGIGGTLSTVNQDWDAPYHGNAIRWISEHATALPSALAQIANLPAGTKYFYPNTYHALLAPLLDKAAGMPELLNLAALSVVLAWPLGIAAMALAWRMPPLGAAIAAAVSTWFTAFPYDSLWRGPLWPYVAGVALVPAVLAIARKILTTPGLTGPLGLALAVAGLTGLHTSLVFIAFVYLLMLALALVFKFEPIDWRVSWKPLAITAVLGLVAVIPVMMPALVQSAGVTGAQWDEFASPAEGIGQTLLFSPVATYPQWFLGLAAITGIILMIKHRVMLWVVAAFVVVGGMYAGTASLNNDLINTLSGPFYNDAWRFAALIPLAGAVAVGYFGYRVATALTAKLGSRVSPQRAAFVVPVAFGLAGVLVLGLLGKGAYIGRNAERLSETNNEGATVTRGEREAYQWLAQHSKDRPVVNDRLDGSVWMYALAGVKPVEWTFYGADEKSNAGQITWHLQDIDKDPDVRKAINALGVKYAVVGAGYVRQNSRPAPGLMALERLPEVRKVYENPQATIYEFVEPGTGQSS
ncbi:DUF6541 family protein [Lentzea sp. CC55]|uniref:DUF6541 family protein n=1 Tax=Lentzea sp. CC55 TaxID=2884909 RepID=UPI001F2AE79B|nr:DUF6541 family protein [Lentzea sp. CC55]MCG8920854.1 hypothetical protein [Lentzea sp. CC55]